jgi:hypothetical protein
MQLLRSDTYLMPVHLAGLPACCLASCLVSALWVHWALLLQVQCGTCSAAALRCALPPATARAAAAAGKAHVVRPVAAQ